MHHICGKGYVALSIYPVCSVLFSYFSLVECYDKSVLRITFYIFIHLYDSYVILHHAYVKSLV